MNTDKQLDIARSALERIENLGAEEPLQDRTSLMFGIAHQALCDLDALERPDYYTCDLCGRAALPDDIFCEHHRRAENALT